MRAKETGKRYRVKTEKKKKKLPLIVHATIQNHHHAPPVHVGSVGTAGRKDITESSETIIILCGRGSA